MGKHVRWQWALIALLMVGHSMTWAQDAPAEASTAGISAPTPTYIWPDSLRQAASALDIKALNVTDDSVLEPVGRALRLGDTGPAVSALAMKLQARGFLVFEPPMVYDTYDEQMETAVKQAQQTYGIDPDGLAGVQVYANLNRQPAATAQALREWAATLHVALDQARRDGASTLIVVNIPSFYLHVLDVQTGEQRLESRVIVGMNTRRTPRYLTHVINIKYNPDWTPPPSLAKRGRVHVPPGINNPLGLLRFSTDNTDNIYLHDTDEHELFERPNRARSSGCIRVQQWHALAEYLTDQDAETIDARLAGGKTNYQKITKNPVLLSYSLVDQIDGSVAVFPDVYNQQDLAIGFDALKTENLSP